jgi:hypothetical protein
MDLLGILVGHTYYFLDTVYPTVARIRGWPLKKIITTPAFLKSLFQEELNFVDSNVIILNNMILFI